ncbi:MAG: sigma-70 family RNA polymerase sigma factor [Terriglobales bacterium]
MSAMQKRQGPHLTVLIGRQHYESMSDTELILACQSKDKEAFEALVKRYQRNVYGLLYQLAPDWSDTSDLAQDVFIRIWRSIGTLRNPHAFRSWLNQLVTNLFYDELRKRPKSPIISMDESIKGDDGEEGATRDIADHSSMPDEMTQRRELSDAIHKAIDKLPEQFRTVIVLRELEGLSYDEIAAVTHTEIGTVKSRIARARLKVQGMLSPFVSAA